MFLKAKSDFTLWKCFPDDLFTVKNGKIGFVRIDLIQSDMKVKPYEIAEGMYKVNDSRHATEIHRSAHAITL